MSAGYSLWSVTPMLDDGSAVLELAAELSAATGEDVAIDVFAAVVTQLITQGAGLGWWSMPDGWVPADDDEFDIVETPDGWILRHPTANVAGRVQGDHGDVFELLIGSLRALRGRDIVPERQAARIHPSPMARPFGLVEPVEA